MKAYVVNRYGKSEKLKVTDWPEPQLRDDDVLIEVYATSVNQLDFKIRNGEFKFILPYHPPFVLGHDVAGVVARVGPSVKHFKPGDRVYSRPDDFRIGTFAERVAVKETSVAIMPHNLSMEEAAAVPLVGLTAWQALVENAKVKNGQKVFIQAGSGGVGTLAIQLAKHLGATVAATTSTANVQWVKGLGADVVIDYKREKFEDVLHDYDVVLNSQDGEALMKSLTVLKPGGRLISISGPPDLAYAKESKAPWIARQVMRALSYSTLRQAKRHQVDYSFLFMKANANQLRDMTQLIELGAIRPIVDKVFPFESTNEALDYVQSGRAKGKVVIKVR